MKYEKSVIKPEEIKFYTFTQNNSGGSFVEDEDIGQYVIIEARSASEANDRARDVGVYFDSTYDCPCCGSRWSEQWDDADGTDQPSIYDSPLDEYSGWRTGYAVIHFLDGRKIKVQLKKEHK